MGGIHPYTIVTVRGRNTQSCLTLSFSTELYMVMSPGFPSHATKTN